MKTAIQIPSAFLLLIALLASPGQSQEKSKPRFMSQEEKQAHQKLYREQIQSISKNIQENLEQIKTMLPRLIEKYPQKTMRFYINQYPFAHPDKKYWSARQEAVVQFNKDGLTKIQFIITEKQHQNGYGFKRTTITDNSPHDGNFEDITIDHKDFLIPQRSTKEQVKDISIIESKAETFQELRRYYNNLTQKITREYYSYLQQKRRTQREIMGQGY